MPRRFTGVLSPPSLAALLALLLVTATLRSQTAAQKPHIAVPFNQVSLLTLQCTANPTSALAGEIIMIQALGTSFQKLPLQYPSARTQAKSSRRGASPCCAPTAWHHKSCTSPVTQPTTRASGSPRASQSRSWRQRSNPAPSISRPARQSRQRLLLRLLLS